MNKEGGVTPEIMQFAYREVDKVKKRILVEMQERGYHWLKWEDLSFPQASIAVVGNNVLIDGQFSMVDKTSLKVRKGEISTVSDKLKTVSGIVPASVIFTGGLDNHMHFRCSFPLNNRDSGDWLKKAVTG